ncbi:hypothetical protein SAMD00019534_056350 [Acytostelium subglobosum LB1]|uniref:hypothetical protein n=1 Tax=Acytostelium subglobosum LB1 TaxID=1410327 RepID=UPI000644C023|nr:hypothetical protein SAMD00019534_056350 [Acytostelium subglobosum LB1]GAM22460.1 hypothetical protein SAMD00019534_056350 [Acytostelium subglobosum LB1]|eukprot:XP_012754580.1 hypothetical protein SAMD00019534_056350 [Acytostelium subglobosum LB1]
MLSSSFRSIDYCINNNNNTNTNVNQYDVNSSCGSTSQRSRRERHHPYLSYYFPNSEILFAKKVCKWVIDSNNNGKNAYTTTLLPMEKMEKGSSGILEVILTDKYVSRVGIRQSQVLWLFLTSAIETMKMYTDTKINMDAVSKRFNINRENLVKMELEFLHYIDFDLRLEEQHINAFLTSVFMEFNCCNIKDITQSLISQLTNQTAMEEEQTPVSPIN